MIKLKRIYEEPVADDGLRILVERLWPRGFTKARAKIDLWLKDVAPSTQLRIWYGHDPAKWEEFRERYWEELENRRDLIKLLKEKDKKGVVTFVYSTHDELLNSAAALKEFLKKNQ